mgnify:CR=1 FL=1
MSKYSQIQQSDEELMVQVMDHHSSFSAKQAEAALVELHHRYSKKLLGYFIKMLHKDVDLAQDFVQDIFLKLMEKKHLFDPNKKFYSWIFTIALTRCMPIPVSSAPTAQGLRASLRSETTSCTSISFWVLPRTRSTPWRVSKSAGALCA